MNKQEGQDLTDDFPDTPARRAVVSVVRGFGALARQMGPQVTRILGRISAVVLLLFGLYQLWVGITALL